MGAIGTERSVDALITALGKEADSLVQTKIVFALGRAGAPRAADAIVAFIRNQFMPLDAGVALIGVLGCDGAIDRLTEVMESGLDNVHVPRKVPEILSWLDRRNVAEDLATICPASEKLVGPLSHALSTRGVDALIRALGARDPTLRGHAAQALGELGAKRAAIKLIACLTDSDAFVRESAAEALGVLGAEQATGPLVAALRDPVPTVRAHAADALGLLRASSATRPLAEILRDGDSSIRAAAAEALGRIGAAEMEGLIVDLLRDARPEVRRAAAEALATIGGRKAEPALRRALEDDSANVRWKAATALARMGSEDSVRALLNAANDGDKLTYQAAIEALGQIRSEAAVDGLLALLGDREVERRRLAVQALEKIRPDRAVEPLIGLLDDQGDWYMGSGHRAVAVLAADALRAINSARALPLLMVDFNSADMIRQRGAYNGLALIQPSGAVTALIGALGDDWKLAGRLLDEVYTPEGAALFASGQHAAFSALQLSDDSWPEP